MITFGCNQVSDITRFSPQALNAIFSLLEMNPNFVFWLRTADCKKQLYVSKAYESIWERNCETLYEHPQSWNSTVVNDDPTSIIDTMLQNTELLKSVYQIILPNGDIKSVYDQSFFLYNQNGEKTALGGFATVMPVNLDANNYKNFILDNQILSNKDFSSVVLAEFKSSFQPLTTVTNHQQKAIINPKYKKNVMFSKREVQCIKYLHQGYTTKQIARELNLSPRTVEEYINNIKIKLGCNSRLEIVSNIDL